MNRFLIVLVLFIAGSSGVLSDENPVHPEWSQADIASVIGYLTLKASGFDRPDVKVHEDLLKRFVRVTSLEGESFRYIETNAKYVYLARCSVDDRVWGIDILTHIKLRTDDEGRPRIESLVRNNIRQLRIWHTTQLGAVENLVTIPQGTRRSLRRNDHPLACSPKTKRIYRRPISDLIFGSRSAVILGDEGKLQERTPPIPSNLSGKTLTSRVRIGSLDLAQVVSLLRLMTQPVGIDRCKSPSPRNRRWVVVSGANESRRDGSCDQLQSTTCARFEKSVAVHRQNALARERIVGASELR